MKLHAKENISTNKWNLQNEYDLTTTIGGTIYKKKWAKQFDENFLSKHNETKTNQLLSEKFGSSSFCHWTCSFRHCSCQINFRHFGHISQFAIHKYHFGDKTHHIQECTWRFSTLLESLNHLTKSLKWSQFDRSNPYLSEACYKFQTDHQCKKYFEKVKSDIQLVTA